VSVNAHQHQQQQLQQLTTLAYLTHSRTMAKLAIFILVVVLVQVSSNVVDDETFVQATREHCFVLFF
jgi:hypothetical protein